MLLPLVGHHLQARRFVAQAAASVPTKKRLWRQIVRAKIELQAHTLETLHGDSAGVRPLMRLVRSGDPENVEARAARAYWPLLFADDDFRRDHERGDQNRLLNYGYTVLRAIVARAICAAGLHPALGLHHHNQYSAFCLADDLMEPFRPTKPLPHGHGSVEHDSKQQSRDRKRAGTRFQFQSTPEQDGIREIALNRPQSTNVFHRFDCDLKVRG